MTGRKNRVVSNEDGMISYESRSKQDVPLELLNIAEKKRFMDGEKVRPGLPLAGHFDIHTGLRCTEHVVKSISLHK